jgi:flagellar biosynthesis/type III secretory pathway M-ring protein FliF/YscJ
MLAQIFDRERREGEKMNEFKNFFLFLLGVLFLLILLFLLWHLFFKLPRDKRREKDMRKLEQEEEEKEIKEFNQKRPKEIAWEKFGLNLGSTLIDKNVTYDEIIRQVNYLALQTARSCVKQDKANRRKGEKEIDKLYDINNEVVSYKVKWSTMRKYALVVSPELGDRMPHFSEFEPLKSYNEEHLLKKKIKSE